MNKAQQVQKIYSLSNMQEGVLFHSLLDKNSNIYLEHVELTINGNLDIGILEESFNALIKRHDIYRTIFVYENVKTPKQVVLSERSMKLHFEDITHMSEQEQAEYLEEYKRKDRARGFNLSRDLLIRASVFKQKEGRHRLIWTDHLILRDGWSFGIIAREFFQIYRCIKDGQPVVLDKIHPYSDYIKWLEKQDKKEAAEYWKEYLKGYEQQAVLPRASKSCKEGDYIRETFTFIIDENLTQGLERIARKNQVTLNIVFQTIWGLLMQRYNNTNDVVFGSVVSGRSSKVDGIEKMVGLFINSIPARVSCTGSEAFSVLVKRVQEAALLSGKYDYCSLAEVQSYSELKQGLFDCLIAFENYPLASEDLEHLTRGLEGVLSICDAQVEEYTNYNFNIEVNIGKELSVKLFYNSLFYDSEFMKSIAEHFKKVAQQVIADDDVPVENIDILTGEERKKLLYDFNDTAAGYPSGQTVHKLFEEQVRRFPERTAVAFENGKLTYGELNAKANQLARLLREKGVKSETIVAIMVERSMEMIIGALAVLKAGGAYLPIDPSYPETRKKFMLEDSGARILLSREDLAKDMGFEGLEIDLSKDAIYRGSGSDLEEFSRPDGIAYIIYTSGTTGRPKGAMIEHRNVVRLMTNDRMQFDFDQNDVWTMFHSFCFDFSVWEMYGALLYGGKLVVVPKLVAQDTGEFLRLLKRERVTILNQTPTAFYNLINEELKAEGKDLSIRYVIFGGEALKPVMLKEWKEKYPLTRLINMYGITETTVHVTYKEITDHEIEHNISNIGKPIPTLTTYIMDRNMRLVPVGVEGELCVGGAGVGRGYLNRPELTAQKFVENPYKQGERLYRSGDLARLLPGGDMEYLGRIDHQVKIRGFRIELSEVESKLLNHEAIREAVVIAREDKNSDRFLCAYIVAEESLTVSVLREYLSKDLPDYMIPSYFFLMEKMPLTANGKVDRKALLAMGETISTGKEYEAPGNETEKKLVEIWKDVLEVDRVGVNDEFFDLGGHSLRAIQIASRAAKEGINLKLNDIFQYPNIKELSEYLQFCTRKESSLITSTEAGERLVSEKTGRTCKLVKSIVEGRDFSVLCIEGLEQADGGKVKEIVKNHFDAAILPHYIIPKQEKDLRPVMSGTEFSDFLALDGSDSREICEGMLADIEKQWQQSAAQVLSGRIIDKYPVAPVQKFNLFLNEFEVTGTIIRLEKYVDLGILQKALLHLIKTQELMRSALVEEEGFFWHEYEAPSEIAIPFIDISGYSIPVQQTILENITSKFFFKDYELNSLMYRALLVKENEKDYLAVLPFSHTAFDGMSGEVIRNSLLKYYELYENGREIPGEGSKSYKDYVLQLNRGPKGLEDEELVRTFELEAMEEYIYSIGRTMGKYDMTKSCSFDFELKTGSLDETVDIERPWQVSFACFDHFVRRYFGVERVPLWIVNYGRNYEGNSYYDKVGEYIDSIPFLTGSGKADPLKMAKSAQDRVNLASRCNVNFSNLAFNESLAAKYPRASRLMRNYLDAPMVFFNFQGKFEEAELDMYRMFLNLGLAQKEIKKMMLEVKYSMDTIRMTLLLPYEEKRDKLDKLFAEAAGIALSYKGDC